MFCAITRERLKRAAVANGLAVNGNDRFRPPEQESDWRIVQGQDGWLTIERPAEGDGGKDHIIEHADWSGPVKLVAGPEGPVQRIDVFFANHFSERLDSFLHPKADEDFDRILSALFAQAGALFSQDRAVLDRWKPPDTQRLVTWLSRAGHTVAKDQEGNLRITIRASGRDGQVHVVCREGHFRFVLPLGTWPQLGPATEGAMRLAHQANNHLRLARISWRSSEANCSCEAQVDLTGLGSPHDADSSDDGVMRDMVQLAVDALGLAMRQLKHELEILADPRQEDLAEMVFFDRV